MKIAECGHPTLLPVVDELAFLVQDDILCVQGGVVFGEAEVLIDAGESEGNQRPLFLSEVAGHNADKVQ